MSRSDALHRQADALRAQADALDALAEDLDLEPAAPRGPELLPEPETSAETWRSRIHRLHEATRLTLDEAAEALGVSTRTVRRYVAGEGDYHALPASRGPTGLTVQAGELREWIRDVEDGNRFREAG